MRIIQTFWSGGRDPLQYGYGWRHAEHNQMSWALSCCSLREHYDQVELYTDQRGYDLLIEKIPITTTNTTQIIATNNIVTLRGHNCLPKILPTTIKNITLHGQYHLFTSKVRVGSVEDETGKVFVPQGCNVLLENAETFEIKENTIIEKGATIAIIELREVNTNDTIWTEEDVHPKRKSPGIRIPIPIVEYIPEQGVILFESSTDQSVCYCIAEGDDMDNPIASGELELVQGEDVQICWQGGDYPNGYNLYIWVNGHSYVGKIE